MGCVVLSFTGSIAKEESFWLGLLPLSLGLIFAGIGLGGLLNGGKVIFDRRSKVIIGQRRTWGRLIHEKPIRFDNVAAVQICSRFVSGDDSSDYTLYEINLVLSDPEGVPMNLACHANEGRIRADAGILAQMLGCPLLDHSEKPVNVNWKNVVAAFSKRWKKVADFSSRRT